MSGGVLAYDALGIDAGFNNGTRSHCLLGVRDAASGEVLREPRMIANAIIQVGLFSLLVTVISVPLGLYMARVFTGERTFLDPVLRPVERGIYRFCGIHPGSEQDWIEYTIAMLLFSAVGMLLLYGMERLQYFLPLNPQKFAAVAPDLAFNTAASFTTNTNWQAYGDRKSTRLN